MPENEIKPAYKNSSDEFHDLFTWAMGVEQELFDNGALNVYAFKGRDLTNWITRVGTVIEVDGRTRYVLKTSVDEALPDGGSFVFSAGYDLKAAALEYLNRAKPHWGPGKPLSDLTSDAFGLDGQTVTLAAQARYIREECNGDANLAALKAKEFGTSLGSLKPGKRPQHDKGKPLPPAAAAISKNPWLLSEDDPAAIARRTSVITGLGTKVAAQLAHAAGKQLSGRPLAQ